MKWGVILILLVAAGAVAFYFLGRGATQPTISLQIAFGPPEKDSILLEIILVSSLTTADPPDGDTRYNSVWQQWVDGHFELLDASGTKLPLLYENQASLAVLNASRGSPDVGFLRAVLKPGRAYDLRYHAKTESPAFQTRLTAPEGASGAQIVALQRAGAGR